MAQDGRRWRFPAHRPAAIDRRYKTVKTIATILSSLMVFSAGAASPTGPVRTVSSSTGQFIVRGPSISPVGTNSQGAEAGLIELSPDILAISGERIKRVVARTDVGRSLARAYLPRDQSGPVHQSGAHHRRQTVHGRLAVSNGTAALDRETQARAGSAPGPVAGDCEPQRRIAVGRSPALALGGVGAAFDPVEPGGPDPAAAAVEPQPREHQLADATGPTARSAQGRARTVAVPRGAHVRQAERRLAGPGTGRDLEDLPGVRAVVRQPTFAVARRPGDTGGNAV